MKIPNLVHHFPNRKDFQGDGLSKIELLNCAVYLHTIHDFLPVEQTSTILYQTSLVALGISAVCYLILRKRWCVYILLLGGFLLALSAIHRDDYLYLWDERYHALVAKNVMDSPLEPKLYKDTLIPEANYSGWYNAHIWLHKQPLFLWQMAATMHIFGDNLIGMRLSSALMLLLFTFAVYKATDLYYPKSSFWVAFLAAIQPYLLLLVSGRTGMDHNDIAFIAWIATSFWGLVAYFKQPHWKWLLLIGISVGFAMLTKWLAGSFVLWVWGLHLILNKDFHWKSWRHLFATGLIAIVVFTPWQLYSYLQYPEVFLMEWEYNSRHLTEALEDHGHGWNFHLMVWKTNFTLISTLFLLGTGFLLSRRSRSKLNLTLVLSVAAVLVFYSWAKTRLSSYTLFLLPLLLFIGASFLEKIKPQVLRILAAGILVYFGYLEFRNQYLYNMRDEQHAEHQRALQQLSKEIAARYPEKTVIFNVPNMEFVEVMFYSDRLAYEFIPAPEQVRYVKRKGYRSVVLLPPQAPPDSSLLGLVDFVHADIYER